MIDCALDASAVLALLQDEPGADRVATALPTGVVSSVNFAEVVGKLTDKGMPPELVRKTLDSLDMNIHEFDRLLAYAAGELRAATAAYGLSLGDRACLALAQHLKIPAITADSAWQQLDIDDVTVELIR